MKEYFLIAWRNLWRNKRRTLITISSIFFAVFFSIIMRSFQLGTYSHMIDNMVTQFTGHLQIQDIEYEDNQMIDYSIPFTDTIIDILEKNKNVEFYFPRIQTGALASSGKNSKFAIIMGVDYLKENELMNFKRNIAQFYIDSIALNNIKQNIDLHNYNVLKKFKNKVFSNKEDLREELHSVGFDTVNFVQIVYQFTKLPELIYDESTNDIIIGYKLAQYLELNIGDSIILIGQGFRGASAAGKYKISGFLNFPADGFNDRFIYMPLKTSQLFLSAYETNYSNDTTFFVNYLAVNTTHQASVRESDYKKIVQVKTELQQEIKNELITVVDWHTLNKDLIQGIEMDNESGKIMIFVLYLIIAFGVLGTVMMMIAERKKEFGMMMAIGMKRKVLSLIVSIEIFFMGLIAVLSGIIVTAPIIWFGHKYPFRLRGHAAESMDMYNIEPVLSLQSFDTYILSQLLVVVVIVAFVLVYAMIKIRKLKIINALKS